MKLTAVLSRLALASALLSLETNAYTNPITIKNYKMYDAKTGAYFGVKGVDYYPRPNAGELDVNNHDFFSDSDIEIWGPDLAQLAALGANAVRLYAVNPSLSHDKFMCALRSYGMYALVDLGANCLGCAITNDVAPACYPESLKSRGEEIINAFAKYDNLLAFSAGNEVNHVAKHKDPTTNAPCQKKFLRDMRAYIGSCATLRQIPVGVVLADSANERELNAKYYNCRTNASDVYENAEWYGLNVYQHCDGAQTEPTPVGPGFKIALNDFTAYKMNIPVMFTEFGCLHKTFPTVDGYEAQRTWLQAAWIHSKEFRQQFNGGFVFEYSTENANSKADAPYPFTKLGGQNYGLGYFSPKDCNHGSIKCEYQRMPNYNYLAEQYNATDYSDEKAMSEFTPDATKLSFPTCPGNVKKLSEFEWAADSIGLSCPSEPLEFTCPSQVSSGKWTAASLSGATNAPTPKPAETKAPTPTSATPGATTPSPSGTSSSGTSGATSVVMQGVVVTLLAVSTALAVLF